jgi:hypothetical protein
MNIAENKNGLFTWGIVDARKIHNVNIGPVVSSKTALGIFLYQKLIVAKAMLSFQVVKKGK